MHFPNRERTAAGLFALLVGAQTAFANGAEFRLFEAPLGYEYFIASSLTSDGRYVLGEAIPPGGAYAVNGVWSTSGDPLVTSSEYFPIAAASDASTIYFSHGAPLGGGSYAQWTPRYGFREIPNFDNDAARTTISDVSGDGRVLAGYRLDTGLFKPYRWTEATGYKYPPLDPCQKVRGVQISDDGSTIAFSAHNICGSLPAESAYVWNSNGQLRQIHARDSISLVLQVADVSANGSTVVGNFGAWRWTEAGGMQDPLYQGGTSSVSANGRIVGGAESAFLLSSSWAILWDGKHGARNVRDMLLRQPDPSPTLADWHLTSVLDMSADGKTLIGFAQPMRFGSQRSRYWIATVPEPSTLILAAILVGILILVPIARKARRLAPSNPCRTFRADLI